MNTQNPYLRHRHRFPSEIISHCVWLYYRFSLSYRDIELMMAERGLEVTYESIRYRCLRCLKFGHLYAKQMKKRKDVIWFDFEIFMLSLILSVQKHPPLRWVISKVLIYTTYSSSSCSSNLLAKCCCTCAGTAA